MEEKENNENNETKKENNQKYNEKIDKLIKESITPRKPKTLQKQSKKITEQELTQNIQELTDELITYTSKTDTQHDYDYISILAQKNTAERELAIELAKNIYTYLYKTSKNTWLRYNDTDNDYYTIILKTKDFNIIYDIIKDNLEHE